MGSELTELSNINKGEAIASAEKGHVIVITNELTAVELLYEQNTKLFIFSQSLLVNQG